MRLFLKNLLERILTIPFISQPTFEFDPAKSDSNKNKHGIDFVEAQAIWTDEQRLEIPATDSTEQRFQVLGTADERLWSAFITYREGRIRIISVRNIRKDEKERYHGQ
jgi:uncharacterized DUF497 family protein